MKIKDQVASYEQARILNDLGIRQGLTPFFFDGPGSLRYNHHPIGGFSQAETCFSAFGVAELGDMLPYDQFLSGHRIHDKWFCAFYPKKHKSFFDKDAAVRSLPERSTCGETEAEARAAMLIHLLENNLTTASEVNDRLNK